MHVRNTGLLAVKTRQLYLSFKKLEVGSHIGSLTATIRQVKCHYELLYDSPFYVYDFYYLFLG